MLRLLTHFKRKCEPEWATFKVKDIEFKVTAKLYKGQAFLLIDAPKEDVEVTREKLLLLNEEEEKDYRKRVLGKFWVIAYFLWLVNLLKKVAIYWWLDQSIQREVISCGLKTLKLFIITSPIINYDGHT